MPATRLGIDTPCERAECITVPPSEEEALGKSLPESMAGRSVGHPQWMLTTHKRHGASDFDSFPQHENLARQRAARSACEEA